MTLNMVFSAKSLAPGNYPCAVCIMSKVEYYFPPALGELSRPHLINAST